MEDMNMFSESLISFETAKLSKEKGFDYAVMSYYSHPTEYKPELTLYNINEEDELDFRNWNKMDDFPWRYFSAPTQNFLQKWLREVHKIDIVIGSNVLGYHVLLYDRNTGKTINISPVNLTQFYEEALEIGLLTALKLIN